MFTGKITYLQKKKHGKNVTIFSTQIVAPKIGTEFVFLDILTKPNALITHSSVTLSQKGIIYICLTCIKEVFNNFGEKYNCESFSMFIFCMRVIFLVKISIVVSFFHGRLTH